MIHDVTTTVRDTKRYHAAREMLTTFFMLLKTARFYETDNDAYQRQSTRFLETLTKYMRSRNSCTIKTADHRLFVDESFIQIDFDDKIGIKSAIERWDELEIGGLSIGDTATAKHFDIFTRALWEFSSEEKTSFKNFQNFMVEEGVNSIFLIPRQMLAENERITVEHRRKIRKQARKTFFQAISTVKEVVSEAATEKKLSVARTKRVVHSIIDQISEDESALLELASIKDHDDYTYAHCANVCVYTLTLGFHLGLSRRELSELGFAALFHDIGKVKLPNELINKPEKYDEFDWEQMRKHPVYGAMTIASSLKLDRYMARAMAVAFEHHVNPDHTGYPTLPEERPVNFYARIVSIADSFDALSSGRTYIKDPIPADEVLRKLMYQMSSKFDTILLKLFVNIIGVYPVGSLVLLSNDTLAIISQTNPEDLHRPQVRMIANKDGELEEVVWLDLTDEENRSVNIVRLIDPEKYGIDLSKYIYDD